MTLLQTSLRGGLLILALALFRAVSAPEGAEPPAELDLNKDNRINTRDALLLYRLLAVREDK